LELATVFFRANHLSAVERRQSWGEISQRELTHLPPGSTQFSVYAARDVSPILIVGSGTVVERSEVEETMPLIQIVIVLIVIGVLLWLVNLIPMQGTIKSILNAVVVICVVLWLLNVFGVLSYLPHIRVGS
jgi:hypothetical protein